MGQRVEIAWAAVGIFGFFLFLCVASFAAILSFALFSGAPHAFGPDRPAGWAVVLVAGVSLWLAFVALRSAVRRLKPFFQR